MEKKYTVIAYRWFDSTYGNTYHSVRCIRHSDGAVIGSGKTLVYGYGSHYEQTALQLMTAHNWINCCKSKLYLYNRENNYPIIWNVSDGLKRDAVRNGEL